MELFPKKWPCEWTHGGEQAWARRLGVRPATQAPARNRGCESNTPGRRQFLAQEAWQGQRKGKFPEPEREMLKASRAVGHQAKAQRKAEEGAAGAVLPHGL